MSNILETLVVKIASDITDFQSGISSALKSTAEFEQAVNKIGNLGESITKIGDSISKAGSSLTKYITTPILGLGTAIAKIGMDFEAQMSRVRAISGATGDEMEALTNKAKEMGATTQFTSTQAGEALEYMAMAGWDTNQMLDGLEGVMYLAAASGENLAIVSDIVTDALTAFGMEAEDAGHFADVLAATSAGANTNVGMMGETFKYAAPVAGALGYTLEDTALAAGLMANSGIKASQAGTTLRQIITGLQGGVELTGKAFDSLRIEVENSDGSMRDFEDVVIDLRDAFGQMTEAEKVMNAEAIAGKLGMSGLLAIVNAGEEDFNNLAEAINNCEGAAAEMAATAQDNLAGRLTILKSSIEGVANQLYDILLPSFEKLVAKLQDAVTWFSNLSPATQETIIKAAALAAAIGPVVLVVGKLVSGVGGIVTAFSKFASLAPLVAKLGAAVSALAGPVGIAVAAVAGLVAVFVGLYNTNEEFREKIQTIWEGITEFFAGVFEGIKSIAETAFNSLSEFWDTWGSDILAFFSGLWEGVGSLFNLALDGLILAAELIFGGLAAFWDTWGADILAALSAIWDFLVDTFTRVVGGLWDTAVAVFNALKEFWDTWGADITAAFSNVLNTILEFFGSIFESIENIVQHIFNGIQDFWDAWGGTIIAIFTGALETVKTFIETVFNNLKDFWDKWGTVISAFFVGLWELLCNAFETALNILKNLFKIFEGVFTGDWERVWEGVKGVFTSILDGIKNAFETIFNKIHTICKEILENMKNSVRERMESVREVISGVLDIVKNMFGELPAQALQWGKNLINGFVDGIKSMASAVSNAVSGVIGGVKDFLGFNSPAKKGEGRNIVKWGYNMIEGFLDGVGSALPSLHQRMDEIIPNMTQALGKNSFPAADMASSASLGGRSGGNPSIHIYTEGLFKGAEISVRDDSDIDRIVRLVISRLGDYISQHVRELGIQ